VDVFGQVRVDQPEQRLDPGCGADHRGAAPGRRDGDSGGVAQQPGLGDLLGQRLPVSGGDAAHPKAGEPGEEGGVGVAGPPGADGWARSAAGGQLHRGELGGVVDECEHLLGELAALRAVVGQAGDEQQVGQAAHADTDLAFGAHHLR
jgi:hypothetical protein